MKINRHGEIVPEKEFQLNVQQRQNNDKFERCYLKELLKSSSSVSFHSFSYQSVRLELFNWKKQEKLI